MSKTNTLKGVVDTLKHLLSELQGLPALQQNQRLTRQLEIALARIRSAKHRQIERQTAGRQATRRLAKALADSRYSVACLRSYLKSYSADPDDDRLGLAFGRKRESRRKACSQNPKTQTN